MDPRELNHLFEQMSPTPDQEEAILARLQAPEKAVKNPSRSWKKSVFVLTAAAAMALAVPAFGFSAACLASPAAWILADLFLFPAYFLCHRRLRSAPVLSGACSEERAERPGEGLRRTA